MEMTMLVVIIFTLFCVTRMEARKYSTKWDHVNVEEILNSDRLLRNYKNCLLDVGSCTPEGTDLKRTLPDALLSECSKCSEVQKEKTEKVVDFFIKNKPEWWMELSAKYDPDGVYLKKAQELKMSFPKQEKNTKATTEK